MLIFFKKEKLWSWLSRDGGLIGSLITAGLLECRLGQRGSICVALPSSHMDVFYLTPHVHTCSHAAGELPVVTGSSSVVHCPMKVEAGL